MRARTESLIRHELSTQESEYIVERYHMAFRIELHRLEQLGLARNALGLAGVGDVGGAIVELREKLLRHMDDQEQQLNRCTVCTVCTAEHDLVRVATCRLRRALETADPRADRRLRALVSGLAHLAAEIDDHLDIERRFAHREAGAQFDRLER